MDKILIWVSGNINEASRRYRVDCYLHEFKKYYKVIYFENISLKNAILNLNIFFYIYQLLFVKCIFLQRRLIPIWLVKILKIFNKKIIFDIDDAIHVYNIYNSYDFEKFGTLMNTIIVGNENLFNYWKCYNKSVCKIETGVEYQKYQLRKFNSDQIQFLWVGTSSNFNNLQIFLDIFNNSNFKNLKLKVISDQIPEGIRETTQVIDFEYWTDETDFKLANSSISYIGIMPLDILDNQSKFKCSFKMLQYMNWSLPVMVTACGMNEDILKMNEIGFRLTCVEDFDKHIALFIDNPELYNTMGKNGNSLIWNSFSKEIIFNKYKNIIDNELSNL